MESGLPPQAGAYVLVIDLGAPVEMTVGRRALRIAPGRYAYCGSAYGPGGIEARVRRHLRHGKRPHWHVDRLTEAGTVVAAFGLAGGGECAVLRRLLGVAGVAQEAPGFGSSDCRTCVSHLVRLPRGLDGAALATTLEATLSDAPRLWSTSRVIRQACESA